MAYVPPLNGGRINGSITGNTAGTPGLVSTGTMVLAGGNNVTLSQSGSTVTISAANAPTASVNFSAGTTSNNLSAVTFSNSNGLSFGLNGSVITGSHNGITSQSVQTQNMVSFGGSTGNIIVSNANNVSFGANNSTVTASAFVNMSAGTTSNNLSNMVFSNANGVSFGLSGSTVTGSHNAVTSQSNQSLGLYALGNSTQNSSTTLDARSVSLNGLGGMTVGYSGSSVQLSVPAASSVSASGIINISTNGNTVSIGAPAFSAGISNIGNTSGNSGTVTNQILFAGGNNITLSQSTGAGGNTITISGNNAFSAGLSNIGNTSGTSGTASNQVVFAGGNNITLSQSTGAGGNTITVVGAGGAFAAGISTNGNTSGTTGLATGRMLLVGGNNITLSQGTGAGGSNTLTVSGVSFSNLNGITFGLNGGTLTASHNGLTAQSTQTIGLGGTAGGSTASVGSASVTGAQLRYNFYAGSNITLSQSANGASGSLSIYGGAGGGIAVGDGVANITSGTARVSGVGALTASVNGQTLSLSVPAQSNLSATGIVSISNNGSTISIGAPAFSAGMSTIGNTSGTTGTVSNQLIFAGGSNITLSQSTGAGGNTISIIGGAGGGGGGVALAGGGTTYTSGTANFSVAGGALTIASSTAGGGAQSFNLSAPSVSSLSASGNISISSSGTTITISGGKRIGSTTSSATPSINTDQYDIYKITALAANVTSFTTNLSGTPSDGQTLWIVITDNGSARTLAWGSSFEASTIGLPTVTTASTRMDVGFIWNAATSKWRCVAVA